MKKLLTISFLLLFVGTLQAAPPSRTKTYTSGTTIRSNDVTENEDNIFNYLTAGVDTYADDTILNADVNTSAAILATKLNLSTIAQNITFTGDNTFAGTTIADLGTVTTAVISGIDLNGGAIDDTQIGTTTPNTGKFNDLTITGSLKHTTQNQGDVLYDDGTIITRLTPGTSGQFLSTGGAAANPSWATDNQPSNVVFAFAGQTDTVGWLNAPTYTTAASSNYSFWAIASTTSYQTVISTKWKKFAGVDTVTVLAQIWQASGTETANCQVDIGGQTGNASGTAAQATPEWLSAFTVDVSGLSDGTTYDVTIDLKTTASTTAYLGSIIAFGS